MVSRTIAKLEGAIGNVKKGRWEKDLSIPMLEASDLLDKVRMWFSFKRTKSVNNSADLKNVVLFLHSCKGVH